MPFIRSTGCAAALATALSSVGLAAQAATVCWVTDPGRAAPACAGFADGNRVGVDAAGLELGTGNANGGPGHATGFYRIDGGGERDVLGLRDAAIANAVPYATPATPAAPATPEVPAVPEMQGYALLLAGLAGVAFVTRRRSSYR